MKPLARPLILLVLATVAGCAASRPVLYPNPKLNQSGPAVGKLAVEDCRRQADAANVDDGQAAGVARSTGVGAAVGAATGAAVGAVLGNAGRGAATGAAGGRARCTRPMSTAACATRATRCWAGSRAAGACPAVPNALFPLARCGRLAYRRAVKPGVPAVASGGSG
jgi:hypothetical protein